MNSLSVLILVAFAGLAAAQSYGSYQSQNQQDGMMGRNNVPDTVTACYRNQTAYNRFTRQPMHIENLIAIIRKIEEKTLGMWDMRKVSRSILNRFQFDGLRYNANQKHEFQFDPTSEEVAKTLLVRSMLPGDEMLPEGLLDNDERCALHWMLSHSLNATMRDEELSSIRYHGNLRAKRWTWDEENKSSESAEVVDASKEAQVNAEQTKDAVPAAAGQEDVAKSAEDNSVEKVQTSSIENSKEKPAAPAAVSGSEAQPEKSESVNVEVEESSAEKQSEDTPAENPVVGSRILGIHNDDDDTEILDGATGNDGGSFAQQVQQASKTKMPVETGVVYTRWGSVSAARVIAGIAAGLEPSSMTSSGFIQQSTGVSFGSIVPNRNTPENPANGNPMNGNPMNPGNSGYNNPNYNSRPNQNWNGRKRRQAYPNLAFVPLENVFAGTLAGDIGQAAILNGKSQLTNSVLPPKGSFNNTVCPREYILEALPDPSRDVYNPTHSWSYMTDAEIRGGVDGLILGTKIRDWNAGSNMKLSDILEMYYSENGVAGDPSFRSCDRSSLSNAIDAQKLREQARTFAWIYSNRTSKDFGNVDTNPNLFEQLVNDANAAARTAINNFRMDPQCTRRLGGSGDTDDNLKFTEPRTTIWAVIDQTATRDEIIQQQLFLGALVAELDVSPRGSRVGLIDGSSGQILISPNFTDNSAVLSCAIMGRDLPPRTTDDKRRVLEAFRSELVRLRNLEMTNDWTLGEGNGVTLLFFIQGRQIETNIQGDIRRLSSEIVSEFGDVSIMYASNKVQLNQIEGMLLDKEFSFVQLQGGNITIPTAITQFVDNYQKKTQGKLYYPRCNANMYDQGEEHKQATDFYLTPGSLQYYKISPDYFYSARNLKLRFTTDNGKARICLSRSERFPGQNIQGSECKETSGNYAVPGSSTLDIEFSVSKPCGKHGKRGGCGPIYLSATPTTIPQNSGGLPCDPNNNCQPNKVRVTFTHWDMRCNSGLRNMLSSPVALIAVLTSLFMWSKST